jgi:beta-phosphoglucomutase
MLPFLPAAFLFDLDGVIADSSEAHVEAYELACEAHDVHFPESARREARRGAARHEVLALLDLSPSLRERVAHAKAEAFRRLLSSQRVTRAQGSERLLIALKDAGVPAAIVSNSRDAVIVIESLGLTWAFETIVDGSAVTAPKPSPEGFIVAARRLGVAINRCVAVEDTTAGAEAASEAGAFVVVVGDAEPADYRISGLADLPVQPWVRATPG